MRVVRRGVVALAALLSLLVVTGPAGPASADEWDPTGGNAASGYTASVTVRLSGDAAPATSRVLRVRPACWWMPAGGPYTDAAAMLDWYDDMSGGQATGGQIDDFGPREIWVDAADQEKDGGDVSWYHAYCRDPKNYPSFAAIGGVDFVNPAPGPVTFVTYLYRAFDVGAALPPPLVDPEDLAKAARDVMVIPVPQTDRNPKIRAAGAPTLVGLPTWFWVQNPAAVGGAAGTRTIRAEVGDVWAEVVAATSGLTLRSAAGGATCPPARATTRYGPGVNAANACTVEFSHASVAYPKGYPVTATTGWKADWTGSGGTGGVLDPLVRTVVVQVPVAEVQNVVTR